MTGFMVACLNELWLFVPNPNGSQHPNIALKQAQVCRQINIYQFSTR
jgi:hypothetical protein